MASVTEESVFKAKKQKKESVKSELNLEETVTVGADDVY